MSTTSDLERDKLAVYAVIRQIPPGCVASYGQVAKLAGRPQGARWVGKLLSRLPADSTLPWFRVLNSQGRISLPGQSGDRQKQLLLNDGTLVVNGRVDLKQHLWQP